MPAVRFVTDEYDPDEGVVLAPLPSEWAEAFLGPLATCDLCRLDWPTEHLESVEWTDTAGETWERRFCASCREKEGLS